MWAPPPSPLLYVKEQQQSVSLCLATPQTPESFQTTKTPLGLQGMAHHCTWFSFFLFTSFSMTDRGGN